MRKIIKLVPMYVAFCIITFAFVGCKGFNKTSPWDYSNVTWYSETPVTEFNTVYSGESSLGYIENNGERLEVHLWWGSPTYTFSIYVYNPETEFSGMDKLLLLGKVKYDSTSATLIVKEDNIFDSKYPTVKLIRRER